MKTELKKYADSFESEVLAYKALSKCDFIKQVIGN